jgi:26S proteasome regulatory subunit N9
VFERFVRDFETKINQLRLAEMGVKVAKDIDSVFLHLYHNETSIIDSFVDPQIHLSFLTSLLGRINTEQAKESHVLLLASIAHAKLLYGDLEGTKADMDAALKILDNLENVDNGVNAEYYSVAADYYKVSIPSCSTIYTDVCPVGKSRICTLLQELTALSRMR